jgi:hypothetical protein
MTKLIVAFHNAANFPKMVYTERLHNLILSKFYILCNSVCNMSCIQIWLNSVSTRVKVFLSYDFCTLLRHLINSWRGVKYLEGETFINTQPKRYVMCIVPSRSLIFILCQIQLYPQIEKAKGIGWGIQHAYAK